MWLHGGLGQEAVISCLVYGDPEPEVRTQEAVISCLVYGDPDPEVRTQEAVISCLVYGPKVRSSTADCIVEVLKVRNALAQSIKNENLEKNNIGATGQEYLQ